MCSFNQNLACTDSWKRSFLEDCYVPLNFDIWKNKFIMGHRVEQNPKKDYSASSQQKEDWLFKNYVTVKVPLTLYVGETK